MQSKSLLGEKIAFAKLQKELRSQCFADEPNDRKPFQQDWMEGQSVLSQRRGMVASVHGIV